MTLICLEFRAGFATAAAERGLPVHFVVEKAKSALAGHAHSTVDNLADSEQVVRAVLAAVGGGGARGLLIRSVGNRRVIKFSPANPVGGHAAPDLPW